MIRLPINSHYNFYASASSYLGNITPLLSSFTPTYSHSLLLTPHFSHLLSSVPLPPSYFHILTLITTHYRFLQLNITHSHLTLFISVFFPLKSATLNYWKVFFSLTLTWIYPFSFDTPIYSVPLTFIHSHQVILYTLQLSGDWDRRDCKLMLVRTANKMKLKTEMLCWHEGKNLMHRLTFWILHYKK